MSGVEALFLVGVIANIVQLVDFSTKIFDRIGGFSKDVKDIPESFCDLQIELPLLRNTLKRTSARASSGELDEDTCKAIRPVVLACEQKLENLNAIFADIMPKAGASKIGIVWKSVRSLSKDKEVERIAASIASLVQTLTLHFAEAAGFSFAEKSMIAEAVSKLTISGDEKDSPNYNIPFDLTGAPVAGAFIGRKMELNLLKSHLARETATSKRQLCVIYGLGGLGKTQLAIEFARINKRGFSSVFWLDGTTEETLVQSLIKMEKNEALESQTTSSRQPTNFLESKSKALELLEWFSLPQNNKWLLIYDNIDKTSFEAEENDEESLGTYDITEYLPRSDAGSIIITTRLQRLAVLGESIKLGKLGIDESLAVLEKHARKPLIDPACHSNIETTNAIQNDRLSDILKLVQKLDGLPLALVIAGRYIAKTTVTKYLELYKKSWKELHASTRKLHDYPNRTILTTWTISYESLSKANEPAAKLLHLWSCLSHKDLWYELLSWSKDRSGMPQWLQKITESEISFLGTMASILDQSLIEQKENSNSYSMHSVVYDWLRFYKTGETIDEYIAPATICVGFSVPLETDDKYWVLQQRLLPHADCLFEGNLQLRGFDSVINGDHKLIILGALMNLGNLYLYQCRIECVREIYECVFMGYQQALGPHHKLTIDAFYNLAILYYEQGNLDEAEKAYLQVLEACEMSLGVNDMLTVNTIKNLGIVYTDQGRLAEAEKMFNIALSRREKELGTNHISTLKVVHNLGELYRLLEQAEQMYRRALVGYELTLGLSHPSTLLTISNLGRLCFDAGKIVDAENMYKQALDGQEKTIGPAHLETAHTVRNLGQLYSVDGRLAEAEQMYFRALELYEKLVGPHHTSTQDILKNLGRIYQYQGRLIDAEEMYKRKLARHEAAGELNFLSAITTAYTLGNIYEGQGKLHLAKPLFERLQGQTVFILQCDICGISISCSTIYYHCNICNKGDFDLCEECVLGHAFCLDSEHQITKRGFLKDEYVAAFYSKSELTLPSTVCGESRSTKKDSEKDINIA